MTGIASNESTDSDHLPAQRDVAAFNQTWDEPSEFPGQLATVDNFVIGMRFLVTSFSFFLVSGVFALLMRIQLARSDNHFLGPEVYNRLFTMHGTIMMFLFAVPAVEAVSPAARLASAA